MLINYCAIRPFITIYNISQWSMTMALNALVTCGISNLYFMQNLQNGNMWIDVLDTNSGPYNAWFCLGGIGMNLEEGMCRT